MPHAAPVILTGRVDRRDWPQFLIGLFAGPLRTGDPARTINRLFDSQHVRDLRLIVAAAFIAVILIFVFGLLIELEDALQNPSAPSATTMHLALAALGAFGKYLVPVLGIFGAVLTWAYQTGSTRLGVVDLFACEISTLCRVVSVTDAARVQIEKFKDGPNADRGRGDETHAAARPFTSTESYFPVFEGNVRDLEALEAKVVINITAFYTYMKVFRDSLRALAEIKPSPVELDAPDSQDGPWRAAVRNIVYMLFLGLESARKAIADLVEFEPEKAERTVVILLSELEAYRFLRMHFAVDDRRYKRISLRESDYRNVAPLLYRMLDEIRRRDQNGAERAPDGPREVSQWEPGWLLLPDLKTRYEDAVGRSITDDELLAK